MTVTTVNPYTEKEINSYREDSPAEVNAKIIGLRKAQNEWRKDLPSRLDTLKEVKKRLESSLPELAALMSSEMGKAVSQSESELKKCALLIDYVIANAESMLTPETVKTEAKRSYIRFDPVGTVFLVMPWNFPAWQVLRAAIPALAAGNAVLLKHASIVTGSSLKLQEIFDLDIFKSAVMNGERALQTIASIDAVSFTGSTEVGTKIAGEAGRQLKKSVLELGGSDPYIVLKSADLEDAVKNSVFARMQNNGQSCIASKRFIVHESIYDSFCRGMEDEFAKVRIGDPLNKETFLGPLSSRQQKEIVADQVQKLRSLGSVKELVGGLKGNFVPPTIVRTDAMFNEEVFGPVAIVRKFRDTEECAKLANETPYGLGASVWGQSEEAEKLAPIIESGMVFVNKIVASDPRLPFGGVKKSGLGYELSRYGMLEFTHKRTVWVN